DPRLKTSRTSVEDTFIVIAGFRARRPGAKPEAYHRVWHTLLFTTWKEKRMLWMQQDLMSLREE
ncbi:MAG: hypothetical protein OXH80_01810, partial [Nitrospira sp.]|nr:hypothetical protein [Nitrospira sp.]